METQDIKTKQLLTTQDLSKRWQIAEITLRHWRLKGTGPRCIKLGNAANSPIRYLLEDIESYEKQMEA